MDAFWYAPDGGYRKWRQPHWPQGPDRWLNTCIDEGLKPGLWLSGNTLAKLEPHPAWLDSLDPDNMEMCMFHGGFLPHLLESIQMWYERGVRIFKFDFLRFKATPPSLRRDLLPSEIYDQNEIALRNGLKFLRQQCPEIGLIGYNGFDEIETMTQTDFPFRRTTDLRWLEVFDSMYCGDPRPSDVPAMNFWRSVDVYSDHMVRYYEATGFPLPRIDSCSFMMGTTGTCYKRKSSAWQGMLALSLARGGWVNTYHGNLELLDDEQARWFGKIQSMYDHLLTHGKFTTFGGIPGQGQMYGFLAQGINGALYTVMNPAQQKNTLALPKATEGKILFSDSGFKPILMDHSITLGAEQLAIIGTGSYNDPSFDLGEQEDVVIPTMSNPYPVEFKPESSKSFIATVPPPFKNTFRVTAHQKDERGLSKRSNKGESPPEGIKFDKVMAITAEQAGRAIAVKINYDKAIWSGLSWAVGEISSNDLDPETPLTIRCTTTEKSEVTLNCALYLVDYAKQ
jgi:hypothetical protein